MIIKAKTLIGDITTKQKISGTVNIGSVIEQEPDYYEGNYEVVPDIEQQILQTEDKTLKENMIVKPVPYAEVTNTSNGTTVTIGG